MEKIKVFQIGCGKMSIYTMRYVYEHGAKIVGAVDVNPNLFGKDIGNIMDEEQKGVIVKSVKELEKYIIETKPDIAIVETMSLLNDDIRWAALSEASRSLACNYHWAVVGKKVLELYCDL